MPKKRNFLEDPPLREPIGHVVRQPSPPRKVSIVDVDEVEQIVHKLFAKYDKDRSGYLDKPEVLKLLDDILEHKGRPKTTWNQFVKFFDEYDDNGDGVISKGECYTFVDRFLN